MDALSTIMLLTAIEARFPEFVASDENSESQACVRS